MKKLIILTLVVLTTLEFANSQSVFGLKGGINLNDVIIENALFLPIHLYESNVGFHIGIFSQFNLIEKLALSTELQFIQKGANTGDNRINLNYLEFPVLISFTPIRILSIEAGPSLSYLISANAQNGNSDVFDKPFDFGVTSGIRINLNDKISILGRYYYGISSPRSFPTTLPDFNSTSSNRNIQFGIIYLFNK